MRHLIFLFLVILSLIPAIHSQSKDRAMWVWSTSNIIEYSSSRTDFYNFCANPPGTNDPNAVKGFPRAISVIFMDTHGYVTGDSTQRAKLHFFLKDAHSRNFKVHYLDGDKTWATTNISSGELILDDVLKFNTEVTDPTQRFDGIQYDVEPYLNSGWSDPATQIQIWNGFIQLLTYCQTKVDSVNDGTVFGVAIPRWYDNTPGITYLHQLQNLVDYVAIMDYVDTSTKIISDGGAEVFYADQIGKKAYIGVETQSVSPGTSTFYEEGWGNMEGQLFVVDQYFNNHSGYAGLAIHHYDSYKALPKWGSNGVDITAPALIDSKYVADSSTNYFQFHVVDICGTGVNEEQTILKSKVVNLSAISAVVSGTWKKDSTNYISFYLDSACAVDSKFVFTIHAVDSIGNAVDIKDTILTSTTSIKDIRTGSIKSFNLMQNYPNPFNPSTRIMFTLDKSEKVSLKIYDILGRELKILLNQYLSPGIYKVDFNGSKLPSGIYICVLSSGADTISKKMIILK